MAGICGVEQAKRGGGSRNWGTCLFLYRGHCFCFRSYRRRLVLNIKKRVAERGRLGSPTDGEPGAEVPQFSTSRD